MKSIHQILLVLAISTATFALRTAPVNTQTHTGLTGTKTVTVGADGKEHVQSSFQKNIDGKIETLTEAQFNEELAKLNTAAKHAHTVQEYNTVSADYKWFTEKCQRRHRGWRFRSLPTWEHFHPVEEHYEYQNLPPTVTEEVIEVSVPVGAAVFVDGGNTAQTLTNFEKQLKSMLTTLYSSKTRDEYRKNLKAINDLVAEYNKHNVSVSVPETVYSWEIVDSANHGTVTVTGDKKKDVNNYLKEVKVLLRKLDAQLKDENEYKLIATAIKTLESDAKNKGVASAKIEFPTWADCTCNPKNKGNSVVRTGGSNRVRNPAQTTGGSNTGRTPAQIEAARKRIEAREAAKKAAQANWEKFIAARKAAQQKAREERAAARAEAQRVARVARDAVRADAKRTLESLKSSTTTTLKAGDVRKTLSALLEALYRSVDKAEADETQKLYNDLIAAYKKHFSVQSAPTTITSSSWEIIDEVNHGTISFTGNTQADVKKFLDAAKVLRGKLDSQIDFATYTQINEDAKKIEQDAKAAKLTVYKIELVAWDKCACGNDSRKAALTAFNKAATDIKSELKKDLTKTQFEDLIKLAGDVFDQATKAGITVAKIDLPTWEACACGDKFRDDLTAASAQQSVAKPSGPITANTDTSIRRKPREVRD